METGLITTESRSLGNVIGHMNLEGRYCSFQAFYGDVLRRLEEVEKNEYVNEDMYISALIKLGIVVRGKNMKGIGDDGEKDEVPTMHIGEGIKLLPPKEITDLMLEEMYTEPGNDSPEHGIYRVKRTTTFGFNCQGAEALLEEVTIPVFNLMSQVNDEIEAVYAISDEQKTMLKELGLGIVAYRNVKINEIKRRLL